VFCSESEVIQTPGYLSSAALVSVGARSNYVASAAHYEVVARRVVAALRGSSRPFVLVTGDPPANPQVLSEELGNAVGPGYEVMIIPCGPELRHEDFERAVPMLAGPRATSVAAAPASPLFVFDDFDRLSDRQIEDVFKGTLCRDQTRATGVLLGPLDFLARLERPALHFLKERLAAQFRFQDVGDDEAIAALHNQLLSQRDRRAEARGFRHGILVGLAAGGVVIAASIGAFFILQPTPHLVGAAPASTGRSSSVREEMPMLQLAEEPATSAAPTQAAPSAETTSVIATAPPPLSAPPSPSPKVEDPPPVAVPSVAHPPVGPRLSATEIAALLARGDAFLGTGDITSARLFYERAADAGSGLAALRLGATFESPFPGRAGIGAAADPAQALFWYRRARALGISEAEERIYRIENRKGTNSDDHRTN
jgi:hypothetical protein